MDYPCKDCVRQDVCDHSERCEKWRAWFAGEWRKLRKLFEIPDKPDKEALCTNAGTACP